MADEGEGGGQFFELFVPLFTNKSVQWDNEKWTENNQWFVLKNLIDDINYKFVNSRLLSGER